MRDYRTAIERFDAAYRRKPQDLHEITEAYLALMQTKAPRLPEQVWPPLKEREITPEEAERVYWRMVHGLGRKPRR